MILPIILLITASLLSLVFVYMAVTERDLLKAIVFSAGQSISYAILLQSMSTPDIVMTYVTVSVGLYSALVLLLLARQRGLRVVDSEY